jgi:KDO2-lipid IV(A) lauroyltransferase
VPVTPLRSAPPPRSVPVPPISGRRRRRRTLRALRNAVLARLISGTAALLSIPPLRVAVWIGGVIGATAHVVLRRDRRRTLEHLGIALPEISSYERARIARETFRNAGRSFAELAQWSHIQARFSELVTIEGVEHVERALARGRGMIAVTGHIGNWELLAAGVAQLGYPMCVVVRRVNEDRFDRLIATFRSRAGVRTVRRDDARGLRNLVRILREGGVAALLVDQDTRGPGVFVPFFGHPARTPPGAAVLALRTGAPVVGAFIERRRHGHHIRIVPLHGFDGVGQHRPSVRELTGVFTAAIEGQVRRAPTEWVWWHRRWRHRPAAGMRLKRSA